MFDGHQRDNEYQGFYRSKVYSDGREEQIRILGVTGFEKKISQDESLTFVQAFVNNVSAPKSLEELVFLVENSGRFTVEELLYDDTAEWTAPKWTKPGDVVFFMHTKTAMSSLTAIRTELNRRKEHFSTDEYKEYMDWIERGLRLHKQYGGKIFAVARVSGPLTVYDSPLEDNYHWGSRLYAEMDHVTLLDNPVDISEFRDFLQISRVSGITPVFGGIFTNLKELIARKNKLPWFLAHADATPIPLANINTENWMKLSNEYRRSFMFESQFRHYYVDYLLKAISDRKTIYSECRCQKQGMADSFVDNVIYIKRKYLTVEVKLSVAAEPNIKAQVKKYCYDDRVLLDKKDKAATPDQFHPGKCLIIDTDHVYMYSYDTDNISMKKYHFHFP